MTETKLADFTGNWEEKKGKLKQKFGILTDRDVVLKEGEQDELLERLELILGTSKSDLHKIISEL